MRRLVTDMVVLSHENIEGLIDGQASFGDGLHPEFIQDLLKCLYRAANHEDGYSSQRLTREQWGVVHRCRYHVSEIDAHSNGKKVGDTCIANLRYMLTAYRSLSALMPRVFLERSTCMRP